MADDAWERVPRGMFARLLFPNPVCVLSAYDESAARTNVMTITWLTPASNHGEFVLSMNCARHSLALVRESRRFVLSVAVAGMEPALVAIGSESGTSVDKVAKLGLALCAPGATARAPDSLDEPALRALAPGARRWALIERAPQAATDRALAIAAAHLVCVVTRVLDSDVTGIGGHALVVGAIELAYVRAGYLDDGKTFGARRGLPPLLSFLGSGTFAQVEGRSSCGDDEPVESASV